MSQVLRTNFKIPTTINISEEGFTLSNDPKLGEFKISIPHTNCKRFSYNRNKVVFMEVDESSCVYRAAFEINGRAHTIDIVGFSTIVRGSHCAAVGGYVDLRARAKALFTSFLTAFEAKCNEADYTSVPWLQPIINGETSLTVEEFCIFISFAKLTMMHKVITPDLKDLIREAAVAEAAPLIWSLSRYETENPESEDLTHSLFVSEPHWDWEGEH
jgi:hypothetical protein